MTQATVLLYTYLILFVLNKHCNGMIPHITETPQEENIEILVHAKTARQRRTVDQIPDEVDARISVDGVALDLHLRKNPDITEDVPVYLERGGKIQPFRFQKSEDVGVYQDSNYGASFLIWDKNQFYMFGTLFVHNQTYMIQPPHTSDHQSHTIAKVKDVVGTPSDYIQAPENEKANMEDFKGTHRAVNNARFKRQESRQLNEIEILIVVDSSIYDYWFGKTTGTDVERKASTITTIKQFYAFVMNGINLRFASIQDREYTIKCLYTGVYIADTSDDAPFVSIHTPAIGQTRAKVNAAEVLRAFKTWANTKLIGIHSYDHAMLFTAHDLVTVSEEGDVSSSLLGLAYLGGLCSALRYSINEAISANMVSTAGHELGHNVGAQHDGVKDNECQPSGYLMSAISSADLEIPSRNLGQWRFSSCSQDYFQTFISNLDQNGFNCMKKRSSDLELISPHSFIPGEVYGPDYQCEQAVGKGSYLYRGYYVDTYAKICQVLACSSANGEAKIKGALAWDGTTCGKGKVCQAGDCVSSPTAPSDISDSCPFGDSPVAPGPEQKTCKELLGDGGTSYYCYLNSTRAVCCATCHVHQQNSAGIEDCEFGDKAPWCETLSLIGCYNNDKTCCKTCADRARSDPSCRYGDRAQGCITGRCPLYDNRTRTELCCETCAVKESTTSQTPTTTTQSTSTTTTPTTTTQSTPTTTTPTTTTQSISTTTTPITTTQSTSTTATPTTTTQSISTTTTPITTTQSTSNTAIPTTTTQSISTTTIPTTTTQSTSTTTTPTTTTQSESTTTTPITTTQSTSTPTTTTQSTSTTTTPTTTTQSISTTTIPTTTTQSTSTTTIPTTTTQSISTTTTPTTTTQYTSTTTTPTTTTQSISTTTTPTTPTQSTSTTTTPTTTTQSISTTTTPTTTTQSTSTTTTPTTTTQSTSTITIPTTTTQSISTTTIPTTTTQSTSTTTTPTTPTQSTSTTTTPTTTTQSISATTTPITTTLSTSTSTSKFTIGSTSVETPSPPPPLGCETETDPDWCKTILSIDCYNYDSVCCTKCSEIIGPDPNCRYGNTESFCLTSQCDYYDEAQKEGCCATCPYPEGLSTIATQSTGSPITASPSTTSPSTASPSTASPSTTSLSTASPSAASPSTTSPSTALTNTESSSTASPSTASPSSASPSTKSPSTESSSTASPSTTSSSTASPSTASPSTEVPSTTTSSTTALTTPAPKRKSQMSIILNSRRTITLDVDLSQPLSERYIAMQNDLRTQLNAIYTGYMAALYYRILVTRLRPGSIIVDCEVETDDDLNATAHLIEATVSLVTGESILTISNEPYNVTLLEMGNVTVTSETVLENICNLFDAAGGCHSGSHCIDIAGRAECMPDDLLVSSISPPGVECALLDVSEFCLPGYHCIDIDGQATCEPDDVLVSSISPPGVECAILDVSEFCLPGYHCIDIDGQATCEQDDTTTTSIETSFPIDNESDVDFSDPLSPSYLALEAEVYGELEAIYERRLGTGYVGLTITEMSLGSLIVKYVVQTIDDPVVTAAVNDISACFVTGRETITVSNQTVCAIYLEVASVKVTNATIMDNMCAMFEASGGCLAGSHCVIIDGRTACSPDKTSDGLVLVLTITISVSVILILVVIGVCLSLRAWSLRASSERRLSKTLSMSDTSTKIGSERGFPTMIPYGGISGWNRVAYMTGYSQPYEMGHSGRRASRNDSTHEAPNSPNDRRQSSYRTCHDVNKRTDDCHWPYDLDC